MTITERLRAELVRSKIGLAELAMVTGIDRSNLNKFATGKIGMNLENGVVLATVLGVDLTGEGRREVTYVGRHVTEEVDRALRDIPEAVPRETIPTGAPREELKAVKAIPRSSTPSPVSDSRKAQFEQQRLKKLRGKGG
jgi:transcriptional regulator with XRE-family HTH domain